MTKTLNLIFALIALMIVGCAQVETAANMTKSMANPGGLPEIAPYDEPTVADLPPLLG